MASAQDIEDVEKLLGRRPQGEFNVVVRDEQGLPMVLENAPFLDDGRPMPTRFWLVDKQLVKEIGRLESTGGVKQAERAVDPGELEAYHRRHGEERNARISDDHVGPSPSGGIGGTRIGVKCLHAHYANFLVTGDDPVGRWVDTRLRGEEAPVENEQSEPELGDLYRNVAAVVDLDGPTLVLDIGSSVTLFAFGEGPIAKSVWSADLNGALLERKYFSSDPPTAGELSAALSIVELHVTDALRELPGLERALEALNVVATGAAHLIAAIELGVDADRLPSPATLQRVDAEDLFRTIAVESKAELVHNPGLPAERAVDIVGSTCVLLETLRQLGTDTVTVIAPASLRAAE